MRTRDEDLNGGTNVVFLVFLLGFFHGRSPSRHGAQSSVTSDPSAGAVAHSPSPSGAEEAEDRSVGCCCVPRTMATGFPAVSSGFSPLHGVDFLFGTLLVPDRQFLPPSPRTL